MYVWGLQWLAWMIRGEKYEEDKLVVQESLSEELDFLYDDGVGAMVNPVLKAFVWKAVVETNLANYPYIFAHEEVGAVELEDEDDGLTLEMETLPWVEAELRSELATIDMKVTASDSVVPSILFARKKVMGGIDDLSSESGDLFHLQPRRSPECMNGVGARSVCTRLTIRHFLEASRKSENPVANPPITAQPVECVNESQEQASRVSLNAPFLVIPRAKQDHVSDSTAFFHLKESSESTNVEGARTPSMKLTIRHFVESNKTSIRGVNQRGENTLDKEALHSPEGKHDNVSTLEAGGAGRDTSPNSQSRFANLSLFGCVQHVDCQSKFSQHDPKSEEDPSHAQFRVMNPSMNQSTKPRINFLDMDGSTVSSVRNHLMVVRSEGDYDSFTQGKKQKLSPGRKLKKSGVPTRLSNFPYPQIIDVSDLSGSSGEWSMEPILPPSPTVVQPTALHQLDRETTTCDDDMFLPMLPVIKVSTLQNEPQRETRKVDDQAFLPLSPMVIQPTSHIEPGNESRKSDEDDVLSPVVLQAIVGNETVRKTMTSDNDVMESNFSERVANLVEGACDGIFTGPLAVLNPEEHAVNVYSKVHEFDDCVHGLNASGSNELRQLEQGGEIEICRESEISPEMSTPSITDRDARDVLVVENLTDTKTVSMCEKKTTGLRIPQPANLHDLLFSDSESDVSDGLGTRECRIESLGGSFPPPSRSSSTSSSAPVTSMLLRDASMMSHGAVGNKNVLRAFPTPTSPSGWSNRENKGNHALKTRDLWTPKQVNTKSLRSSLGLRRKVGC
jgi:hypothetical protein